MLEGQVSGPSRRCRQTGRSDALAVVRGRRALPHDLLGFVDLKARQLQVLHHPRGEHRQLAMACTNHLPGLTPDEQPSWTAQLGVYVDRPTRMSRPPLGHKRRAGGRVEARLSQFQGLCELAHIRLVASSIPSLRESKKCLAEQRPSLQEREHDGRAEERFASSVSYGVY